MFVWNAFFGMIITGSHDVPAIKATECGADEKLADYVCVECPAGKTVNGRHGSLAIKAAVCGTNEHFADDVCVKCPAGSTIAGSHDDSAIEATKSGTNVKVLIMFMCNALPER